MNIEHCKAYRLISTQDMKDMGTKGYLLEHNKTKAKVVLMENQDENKVFTIGFRTPPKDSTGVAHIVEHTVLCGSKEFPVKDPFIELAKGSLNTFLNAMTYPDKTVYPVASCNDKDFQNLMHVYLDAVFYPNIYKEEKIFKQEGWHYELESEEAPLKYNGVVFNEMKGVYSDPDSILYRNIQNALFPDTPYGVESGGDPVEIPELTYEDYLDFHSKYYHPSNSYIYLYGDMDMEEKLNWLEEKYLSQFDYLFVDSALPMQKSFDKKQEKYGFYSVPEGDDSKDKVYHSLNFAYGTFDDRKLYRGMQVLEYVLLDAVGAPVKQALLDAGIGSEIKGGFENGLQQMSFTFIAKNARQDQKQDFEKVIYDTLTELAEKGLDRKSLLAALNAMEFQYREGDFGNYPKGLMYGLQMFDSWLYDDKKPFIHLDCGDVFEELRKAMDTDYYEQLIQKYLLDNTHAVLVEMKPNAGLALQVEQETKDKLKAYKESLSREEIAQLIQETIDLKVYQEEPTPKEILEKIPMLKREDIDKKVAPFYLDEKEIAGVKVMHHNITTNDIIYLRLFFHADELEEYMPQMSFLTTLLGYMDTQQHSYTAFDTETNFYTGGIATDVGIYCKGNDKNAYQIKFEARTKVLRSKISQALDLMAEMLFETLFTDEKHLREVVAESRSRLKVRLMSAGHQAAAGRAAAQFSKSSWLNDRSVGLGYYDYLVQLDEHFDEEKERLITGCKAILAKALHKQDLLVSITGNQKDYEAFENEFEGFLKRLQNFEQDEARTAEADSLTKLETFEPKLGVTQEAFSTPAEIQYVAVGGDFSEVAHNYGALRVVRHLLNFDYLWNEVRVKGGAYGVSCQFNRVGEGYFASYRDPNLQATIDTYRNAAAYLENYDAQEREVTKTIIGTISGMDTPLTPNMKGRRSITAYLTEQSIEELQETRDQVLACSIEDIRKLATVIKAVTESGSVCVIGNEQHIQEDSGIFESIKPLS